MKAIATLIAAAFLTACATVSDPPAAQLPVPSSVPPVKVQEAKAALIEIGCKSKSDLAVIIFAAREEGQSEEVILERVKRVVKKQIAKGATLSYADEIDFYRMTRDIFRTTSSGDYKIPVEYIENFAWVEYNSCFIARNGTCSLMVSDGLGTAGGLTQCIDDYL